jgi:two-component system CheB/CheR fusion protein
MLELSEHGHPSTADIGPKPSTRSLRLLVVDDNVDHADSVAAVLRLFGHDVRVAYSGLTALQAAEKYEPHVIMLDIGLPDMTGYEVAQRLRRDPHLKPVTLIAASGYGQEVDRQRSEAAGFDLHLVKPIDPEVLEDALATLPQPPG